MADCIKQVHNNQFVHLDIKFENFIVYKKPFHLKLIDFGTSHPLQAGVAELQTVAGTIGYTAPELFKGYYHQNSDIWSLGVCLWALVTGHLPFSRALVSLSNPDEISYSTLCISSKISSTIYALVLRATIGRLYLVFLNTIQKKEWVYQKLRRLYR